MAETRVDPLTGRPTIVAPARDRRPERPDPCPFCPGHEHLTPPELARTGDGGAWRVRVVPNRYPLVEGAHEVVVLSPDHDRSLGELPVAHAGEVLAVLRDRCRHQAASGRPCPQVYLNHGRAGGASLVHPHAQVVALDAVPPAVRAEARRFGPDGGCPLCPALHTPGDLVVVDGADAVVWCPWASTTPFELLAAPRRHRARFEDTTDDELLGLAAALVPALGRLRRARDDPPYNLAVHSGPPGDREGFHWHVHVWPRLQTAAGFERGTGIAVTTVDPADAATALRAAGRPGRDRPGGAGHPSPVTG